MQKLSEKQKKNLLRLGKIADNKEAGIVQIVSDLEEEIIAKLDLINKMFGIEGKPGKDGAPGESYIMTMEDKIAIANLIKVPIVKQIVERRTETIIKEQPIVKETIIKEAIPLNISPQEVRDLLELLLEDERLDAKSIKNLEVAFKAYLTLNPPNGPMQHPVALGNLPDVGVAGASAEQVLAWNGTYWYPKTIPTGVGSAVLIPTGTIDNSNTNFVFTQKPTLINVNGTFYRETKGWTWTALTLTATLDNPVGTGGDIYALS